MPVWSFTTFTLGWLAVSVNMVRAKLRPYLEYSQAVRMIMCLQADALMDLSPASFVAP